MTSVLKIRDLTKQYGDHLVLRGVSLDVHHGEIKVIMGPSGCGKSTLLRCINRLVDPGSGSIELNGQDITLPNTDLKLLRQQIGFVFQQFALFRHLTVLDNVTLALCKRLGKSKQSAKEKALHELQRFDMASHAHKFPAALSGGQKQRVAIARALAMEPKVLLMDEPTSALDPVKAREVGQLISTLNQDGVTVVCVTHDLDLAMSISERVTFMHDGSVTAEGQATSLARDSDAADIRAFFGRGV